jgi:predicted amidophosphoribosyltransferase
MARLAQDIAGVIGHVLQSLPGGRAGACVPVPSRSLSVWRRGWVPALVLAQGVADGLNRSGVDASVVPGLRRAAATRDQVGLGLRARSTNREGTTVLRRGVLPGPVLLVDDVLTTGASILDAERALARAGVAALGALVLAATPPTRATDATEKTGRAALPRR